MLRARSKTLVILGVFLLTLLGSTSVGLALFENLALEYYWHPSDESFAKALSSSSLRIGILDVIENDESQFDVYLVLDGEARLGRMLVMAETSEQALETAARHLYTLARENGVEDAEILYCPNDASPEDLDPLHRISRPTQPLNKVVIERLVYQRLYDRVKQMEIVRAQARKVLGVTSSGQEINLPDFYVDVPYSREWEWRLNRDHAYPVWYPEIMQKIENHFKTQDDFMIAHSLADAEFVSLNEHGDSLKFSLDWEWLIAETCDWHFESVTEDRYPEMEIPPQDIQSLESPFKPSAPHHPPAHRGNETPHLGDSQAVNPEETELLPGDRDVLLQPSTKLDAIRYVLTAVGAERYLARLSDQEIEEVLAFLTDRGTIPASYRHEVAFALVHGIVTAQDDGSGVSLKPWETVDASEVQAMLDRAWQAIEQIRQQGGRVEGGSPDSKIDEDLPRIQPHFAWIILVACALAFFMIRIKKS